MADATRTKHERDYLERTIETVRNHQGADNCWPQWANIFADEIERLWDEVERYEQARQEDAGRIEKLREQVNSGRTTREALEGLPEGTLPRV